MENEKKKTADKLMKAVKAGEKNPLLRRNIRCHTHSEWADILTAVNSRIRIRYCHTAEAKQG